jgi:hypothetical protein
MGRVRVNEDGTEGKEWQGKLSAGCGKRIVPTGVVRTALALARLDHEPHK